MYVHTSTYKQYITITYNFIIYLYAIIDKMQEYLLLAAMERAALPVRNNWSDNNVVQEAGGSTYSATSACGQLHQSYQAEERDVWMVIIHNNS